jgi:DNA-binding NarL/FixJ family response regulator
MVASPPARKKNRDEFIRAGVEMVRVFLGYHSEVVGIRIADIIRDLTNVELAGIAYSSDTLLSDLDTLAPDIAILDIRLLLAAQIHDLHAMKLRHPSLRFILLYDYPYSRFSRECLRFGAEYCFDIHHEFTNLGSIIAQYSRPYCFETVAPVR